MVERPVNPKYHENVERTNAYAEGNTPCAICGRAIKDRGAFMEVHIVNGGSHLAKEGDTFDEAGDLGCYPVGTDCYRKNPQIHDHVTFT